MGKKCPPNVLARILLTLIPGFTHISGMFLLALADVRHLLIFLSEDSSEM